MNMTAKWEPLHLERLEKIHAWLIKGGDEIAASFDMRKWWLNPETEGSTCATAACIGGYAGLMSGIDLLKGDWTDGLDVGAWLGLGTAETQELFYIEITRFAQWGDITADWAARTVRHLIDTGVVDWRHTAPEGYVNQNIIGDGPI